MYPSYLSHGQLSQHSAAVVLWGLSIVVRVVITFVVVVVVMLFRAIHHGSVHGTVHHGISSVHGSIHHGIGGIVHGVHGGLVHVQQLSAATIISSILCCFLALSFHCTVHHGSVHGGIGGIAIITTLNACNKVVYSVNTTLDSVVDSGHSAVNSALQVLGGFFQSVSNIHGHLLCHVCGIHPRILEPFQLQQHSAAAVVL